MGTLPESLTILMNVEKEFPYLDVNFKQGDQLQAKTVSGAEDRWRVHYVNGTFIAFVDWSDINQWKSEGYVAFDL